MSIPAILTTVFTSLVVPILQYLHEKLFAILAKPYVKSVLIAYSEPSIIASLVSADTAIVNLDNEIENTLDEDDKKADSTSNMLNNRLVYKNSKNVISDIHDIFNGSSAVNKFVYISTDYHLLKYADTGNITYTLPSEAYYNELKSRQDWDDKEYQHVKDELKTKKLNKVIVYNNFQELQKIFIDKFGFTVKI